MENPKKSWEIPGKDGISKERMGNSGKAWDFLVKHWKSRYSMGNLGKACKIPGNLGKAQEIIEKAVKS